MYIRHPIRMHTREESVSRYFRLGTIHLSGSAVADKFLLVLFAKQFWGQCRAVPSWLSLNALGLCRRTALSSSLW
jgi:hypothetical protein